MTSTPIRVSSIIKEEQDSEEKRKLTAKNKHKASSIAAESKQNDEEDEEEEEEEEDWDREMAVSSAASASASVGHVLMDQMISSHQPQDNIVDNPDMHEPIIKNSLSREDIDQSDAFAGDLEQAPSSSPSSSAISQLKSDTDIKSATASTSRHERSSSQISTKTEIRTKPVTQSRKEKSSSKEEKSSGNRAASALFGQIGRDEIGEWLEKDDEPKKKTRSNHSTANHTQSNSISRNASRTSFTKMLPRSHSYSITHRDASFNLLEEKARMEKAWKEQQVAREKALLELQQQDCPKPSFSQVKAIKAGILEKQGGSNFKTWKKRFFLLQGKYLYYFKTPEDTSPRGVISLVSCEVREEPELSTQRNSHVFSVLSYRGWNISLKRDSAQRRYYFSSDNSYDMSEWMSILSKTGTWYALPAAPTNTPPHHSLYRAAFFPTRLSTSIHGAPALLPSSTTTTHAHNKSLSWISTQYGTGVTAIAASQQQQQQQQQQQRSASEISGNNTSSDNHGKIKMAKT